MSTDWSPLSATRRSPAISTVTATGSQSWAARDGPPCPVLPQTPVPATVKRCPAVTACPKSVPVTAGSTRTRQLAVSAMKRSPAASTATPVGWSSSLAVAASPSPLKPALPVPATVTAVRDPARSSWTRCAVASAT